MWKIKQAKSYSIPPKRSSESELSANFAGAGFLTAVVLAFLEACAGAAVAGAVDLAAESSSWESSSSSLLFSKSDLTFFGCFLFCAASSIEGELEDEGAIVAGALRFFCFFSSPLSLSDEDPASPSELQ